MGPGQLRVYLGNVPEIRADPVLVDRIVANLLGDRANGAGVGLGLALSQGPAEAMGGTLEPDLTPGGGLTMTLRLASVDAPGAGPADPSPRQEWGRQP